MEGLCCLHVLSTMWIFVEIPVFFLLVFFSLNLCEPRVCLLRVSYWGSHGSVQKDMDAAYAHFKQFLRTTGIASTQPPFKTWMVLGLLQLVRFGMLIKTIG